MNNPEQVLADLERIYYEKKRLVAEARAKLKLAKAKRRLEIKAENILLDKGKRLSPSDISAQLEVELNREPLLSLVIALNESIAERDRAKVEYRYHRDLYWSERGR